MSRNKKTKVEIKKSSIQKYFDFRDKIFFSRNKPSSKEYHYKIHDPFEILPEFNGLERFNLIGDNWLDKGSNKPFAILYGFAEWKLGIIADYFPEYRVAFLDTKSRLLFPSLNLRYLKNKPAAFIGWGNYQNKAIKKYAKIHKIPIIRIENGFICSAKLGARHSIPYSLLLKKHGSYYDSKKPSDIENLLNKTIVTSDMLERSKEGISLMLNLNLSYSNTSDSYLRKHLPPKTRRRVLVIGQLDTDLSLKHANPDKWSFIELIRLAKYENKDAEILYKPHPKSNLSGYLEKRKLANIAKIISSEIPLLSMLSTIDHVYTISCISGLDAIFRGIKTTVTGSPFYAGWGFTDDRVINFKRRNRNLSTEEFFAIAYLQYPRYLADIKNPYQGFIATCLKIDVDRELLYHNYMTSEVFSEPKGAMQVAQSKYWPKLFFTGNNKIPVFYTYKNFMKLFFFERVKLIAKSNYWKKVDFTVTKNQKIETGLLDKYISTIDFSYLLKGKPSKIQQSTVAYTVCGLLKSDAARSRFLGMISKYLDSDVLNQLLCGLDQSKSGNYLLPHIARFLAENNENDNAIKFLYKNIEPKTSPEGLEQNSKEINYNKSKVITEDKLVIMMELFENYLYNKEYEKAITISNNLLLAGYKINSIIIKRAKIAENLFDFEGAKNLAKFSQSIDIFAENSRSSVILATNTLLEQKSTSKKDFLRSLFINLNLKPNKIINILLLLKRYENHLNVKEYEQIAKSMLNMDNNQNISKAQAYIMVNNAPKAISILENLIAEGHDNDGVKIAYSQALSFNDRVEDAIAVMDEALKVSPSVTNYKEAMRLCVLSANYGKGIQLLNEAQSKKLELGDMIQRKIYFGTRMLKESLETFNEIPIKKIVSSYYKDKYYQHNVSKAKNSIVVLASFGPGDEIRYASSYTFLREHLTHNKIVISCDPRLYNIMTRSFPEFEFVQSKRIRHNEIYKIEDFNKLPGSELTGIIDNKAVEAINETEQVMVGMDLLHRCFPSYEIMLGKSFLKHDTKKQTELLKRFSHINNEKLIGLSWRSSLTTHSRNEHYLTIEELEPIFKIDDVRFVNLQYDECDKELEWVEKRYPGKLINFADIDQYNDFESVASLMKCTDFNISPCTTVLELSGALGCPTLMLSNSSEIYWRKKDNGNSNIDIWHNSVRHVEGKRLGDKNSLVTELANTIQRYLSENDTESSKKKFQVS